MSSAPDVPQALPPAFALPAVRARIAAIFASHLRLTGRPLVPESADIIEAMWRADAVILAHGTEPDPLFFFANRAALAAFETTVEDVLRMPSRLSAEPARREERARLLARVTAEGFIDDYSGIRISALGRRFTIAKATVWNVDDESGSPVGQAATFAAPDFATSS